MQIVSIGDTLQEMSDPIFWEKWEKIYHQFVNRWISTESGKGWNNHLSGTLMYM